MPRNVRNFWIDANIDDRKSTLSGGPARKDGGFYLEILMRDDGDIMSAARIQGVANEDGSLELTITPNNTQREKIITIKTKR